VVPVGRIVADLDVDGVTLCGCARRDSPGLPPRQPRPRAGFRASVAALRSNG
jgi:hypothetical protein